MKNYLIFGARSDLAEFLTSKLLNDGSSVFACHRGEFNFYHPNLKKFKFDLTDFDALNSFFNEIKDIKFNAVINFQGVAIAAPVEYLDVRELKKQLDISLFSFLEILKNLKGKIIPNGLIINLSSMASYSLFPYLAPYSIAKASADILLSCFEIETGIKTVSVKPGVIGTKFWEYCVEENKNSKFLSEYENAGKFLFHNALKNSKKGLKPDDVSKLIYKILNSKNPKSSYIIGKDAHFMRFVSYFEGRILFGIIRKILNVRVKRFLNEK